MTPVTIQMFEFLVTTNLNIYSIKCPERLFTSWTLRVGS